MKRLLSILVSAALLITLVCGVAPTALAAEATVTGVYETDGALYYADWDGTASAGKVYITEEGANGLVEAGYYYIDENGRFYNNEFATVDGDLFYFENGQPCDERGVTAIGDDLYYISWDGIVQTGKVNVITTNDLLDAGTYYADDAGRLAFGGLVNAGGNIYYVDENGQLDAARGVTSIDGNLYYISWNGIVQTGKVNVITTNDLLDAGTYYTDATGRLVFGEFTTIDDQIYYIEADGSLTDKRGAVEIDGNLYYISWDGIVQTGKVWVIVTNGLVGTGWHYAHADGRFGQNEFVDLDGKRYLVGENGALSTARGVVEMDDGRYYISWQGIAQVGKVWVSTTNGLVENDYYYTDENGRFLDTGFHTIDGVRYYIQDGKPLKGVGLIYVDGYYALNRGVVRKGTITFRYRTGDLPAGTYHTDANGRFHDAQYTKVYYPGLGYRMRFDHYIGAAATYEIPASINDIAVYEIGDRAFTGSRALTAITIAETVGRVAGNAFEGCTALQSLHYNGTVTKWTNMGQPRVINGIDVSFVNTVVDYDDVSYELKADGTASLLTYTGSATTFTIPETVEGHTVTAINASAFKGRTLLTQVTIPSTVTSIGASAFYNCSALDNVVIPNQVTALRASVFYNCCSMTNITIPPSVKSIDRKAFYGCTSLSAVHISDMTAWLTINRWYSADKYEYQDNIYSSPMCYGAGLYLNGEAVTELVIPDSITSIHGYSFYGCNTITSVTIHSGVTGYIGMGAFVSCSNLTDIYYDGTASQWNALQAYPPFGHDSVGAAKIHYAESTT